MENNAEEEVKIYNECLLVIEKYSYHAVKEVFPMLESYLKYNIEILEESDLSDRTALERMKTIERKISQCKERDDQLIQIVMGWLNIMSIHLNKELTDSDISSDKVEKYFLLSRDEEDTAQYLDIIATFLEYYEFLVNMLPYFTACTIFVEHYDVEIEQILSLGEKMVLISRQLNPYALRITRSMMEIKSYKETNDQLVEIVVGWLKVISNSF